MNEVEKMYENAGIKKSKCWNDCNTCTRTSCDKNISYVKAKYPPFTAEKQIELIKLLAKTRPIHINLLLDKWTIEGLIRYGIKYDTFEAALSGYINQIWQDLTEEERKQIKEILE